MAVVEPDFVVGSLKEAISIIESASQAPTEPETEDKEQEPGVMRINPSPAPASSPIESAAAHRDVQTPTATVEPSPSTSSATPGPASPPTPPSAGSDPQAGLELIGRQILAELRRSHEQPHAEFSVSKLLAGIVQVIVLAVLFIAYLHRGDADVQTVLIFALVLQAMTIALLLMGRQS